MPLTITIVSKHRDLVGDDCVREYYEEGGTIGRSLQNDWILPDPDRYISGRHATIDYKGGMYYLADTSSNGVYMNGDLEPIGNGNPRRLFDGDRMRMGDFEFEVRIDKGESLIMPLEPEPSVAPDNIEQFVDEDVIETGMQLLDENEITGDDEFQSLLFGGEPSKEQTKSEPAAEAAIESSNDESAGEQNETAEDAANDLIDSFLSGLGMNSDESIASADHAEMMKTAGVVLREFVEGTISLLASRANLKNAFQLDQTLVLPRQNNPMKHADNTHDVIKRLLVGARDEYLGAGDSVREAHRDLVNHQNALLDAMNSAFIEFAERFDPDALQEGFDRTINSAIFPFINKSKYWDLYRDLFPIITGKSGNKISPLLGKEFAKAYERQVAEYRLHDHDATAEPAARPSSGDQAMDPGLIQTQKLEAKNDKNFRDERENSLAEKNSARPAR